MIPLAVLLLAPPQVNPVPIDLSALRVADARRLDGMPVAVELTNLGATDEYRGWTLYAVDGPDDAGRVVWVPGTRNVRGVERAIGTLEVIDHRPAVGAAGTYFPGFTEIRVRLTR